MESQKSEEIKKIIKEELPGLMESDPDIRRFILDMTHERYADKGETENRFDRILDELKQDREARDRRWNEQEKKWDSQDRKWEEKAKRWDEQDRRWEENQKVINQMLVSIKAVDHRIDSTIGALGGRWGIRAEGAFRDGLKAILEGFSGVKVERYEDYDHQGSVFGRPDQVELDIIVHDGTLILCEIKSSMSKSEMYSFWRKKDFYESRHDLKADRVLVISPMIDDRAMKVTEDLGVETYGYAEDVKI